MSTIFLHCALSVFFCLFALLWLVHSAPLLAKLFALFLFLLPALLALPFALFVYFIARSLVVYFSLSFGSSNALHVLLYFSLSSSSSQAARLCRQRKLHGHSSCNEHDGQCIGLDDCALLYALICDLFMLHYTLS